MKKIIITIFILILSPLAVSAHSGCCSHHGGVCGCGCCDGSGLSATCAPYYPECNNDYQPVETPISDPAVQTPVNDQTPPAPAETPTPATPDAPILTATIDQTSSPANSNSAPAETSQSGNGWEWFFGGVAACGVLYAIGKSKKK